MEYQLNDDVAILTFDDGKANVIGHAFMDAMIDGLSRAQQEAAAVVITGRTGLMSGGFDLKEIEKGAEAVKAMMKKGSNMFYRLFSHPQPLIIACTGHAIAAGAFLLLTADNRIGAAGNFNIGLNETSIGSSFPVFGIQIAKTRLNPAYLTRSFVQTEGRTASAISVSRRFGTVRDVPALLKNVRFDQAEQVRRDKHRWRLRHRKGATLTCRYTVDPGTRSLTWDNTHLPVQRQRGRLRHQGRPER